ncbi:MAG TPA: hypothetical protein VHQ96_11500 [Gaiellaceae bacterium]|nr:hypothetical protein [Gaiellaceae bacterium]
MSAHDLGMGTPDQETTYAVRWQEGEEPARVGRLELSSSRVHLEGGGASGRLFSLALRYADVVDVAMARPSMRLGGRPTVEVARSKGHPLRVASIDGLGATREIFERLARLARGAAAT